MTSLTFTDVVNARYSARHFLSTPVAPEQIQGVLMDAQRAPSNCNTQPWQTHVVSGRSRETLSAALLEAMNQQQFSPDFSWDEAAYTGVLAERRQAQGAALYGALGIARDDKEGRMKVIQDNLKFYNAPHVALLFMPVVGDNVRAASDLGMYAQNFLLSLTSRGLAGIPQTILGLFADPVREVLGLDAEMKLLFGISFGHADPSSLSANLRMDRASLSECVHFHD